MDIYTLEVVGESHYQHNLERICGPRTQDGVDIETSATLWPENDNPHDENAIKVVIDGLTVGHLRREDAKKIRRDLGTYTHILCPANIRGSWDRGGGDTAHYGVWIQYSDDDGTFRKASRKNWVRYVLIAGGVGLFACCSCSILLGIISSAGGGG